MNSEKLSSQTGPVWFHYGWLIVIASAAAMVPYIGFFQSFGVFFQPMLQEFGWSQAALAGGFSLTSLSMGFASVFTGVLADKYGPRVVVAASGVLAGLGYLLFFQVHSLWQFYLIFLYLGAARSGVYNPLFSTVSRWFIARKGLALGLVSTGAGLGRTLIPLLAIFLISQLAWRKAFILLGWGEAIILLLVALAIRKQPGDKGLLPYGQRTLTTTENAGLATPIKATMTLRAALASRAFWILCVAGLLSSFGFQIVLIHLVNYATQPYIGFSPVVAASFLSALGMGSIAGRLGMGVVSDRIGRAPALAINFALMAAAVGWLMAAREGVMFYGAASLFGFGFGGSMPLMPAMVGELFGLASMGAIFGVTQAANAIGMAMGPPLAGFIFDATGSYYIAFGLSASAFVAAMVLTLQLGRAGAGRERSQGKDNR